MGSNFKDWLTVTWSQGGMQLNPDGTCDSDSEYDSIKARCGRAGSLAVTPGERLLELLRPNVAIPRRHSTAACAPQAASQQHHYLNTGFKYCPSDALPYCPPSGVQPKIRFTSSKNSSSHPPPVPQRTVPTPSITINKKMSSPIVAASPLIPPPPPARKTTSQPLNRIPPPTPPRPLQNTIKDSNGNTTVIKDMSKMGMIPAKVDNNRNSLQRNQPQQKIISLDNDNYTLDRSSKPPPIITNANNMKRSTSSGSNMSVRQDSNVSSDSFSQTSSPSYTTKTMEAPLLPHQHIKSKLSRGLLAPSKDSNVTNGDPNMSITKSTSTPASLQTIVRLQNGSNVSLHHKVLRDLREQRKQFRIVQVMVNALALLAIAGGFAAYFRAFPAVKYIPQVIVNHTVIEPSPISGEYNPAPGICLPVIVKFCQKEKVPYNFTIFPNYMGHFGQRDAQQELEIYEPVVDVRCYNLTALFLCTIFVPKCGPLGHMVRPCASLCYETMHRCGFFLEVFGLAMPEYLHCDIFSESTDTDVCIGNKEVREERLLAQRPVCPSGFQCDVRRCIPMDWRCDGHIDCFDQSDELNCKDCGRGTIHCGDKRCIAQSHMCDGQIDCPWGQDERNCLRLSGENGDVGKGQLELFRPAEQTWLPACVSHWDEKVTARTLCSMLGYSGVNTSSLEGGWVSPNRPSNSGYSYFRMLQRQDGGLLKQLRTCTSHTPRVNLICQDYMCGKRRTQATARKRIIGGTEASPGDWPFIAAILGGPKEIFYCAGVLIADQWVLTASHCVGNLSDVKGWTIQLGITRRNTHAYYGEKAKVRRVVPHPLYNIGTAHDNDIALFQLEKRVTYNEHLSPVCLPPKERDLKPGTLCTVIGWGKKDDKELSEYEPAVHEVQVPVLSRDLCNAWLEHRDLNVTEGMLCAGYPEGGKDACQGDSGGPLLCTDPEDESRWFVGGIVSWGIKCAHPRLPGVYAYVPKYVTWIRQQIELLSDPDIPEASTKSFNYLEKKNQV